MENRPAQPYILRFKAEGYETQDVPVDSFTFRRRETARFIADVYMEKAIKHKTLEEVTVKATKIKIYTRGDTVAYNADAFQLAEGSMLDALIRQLPGVELKDDGRILVKRALRGKPAAQRRGFFQRRPFRHARKPACLRGQGRESVRQRRGTQRISRKEDR